MDAKKRKLLIASVAGILAVTGLAATAGVVYGMAEKPKKQTEVNTCSGKGGCGSKHSCGGKNSCGSK